MQATKGLHFSTTDLRNKLSVRHNNTKYPIIPQVAAVNNMTSHVIVDIYSPVPSFWHEKSSQGDEPKNQILL